MSPEGEADANACVGRVRGCGNEIRHASRPNHRSGPGRHSSGGTIRTAIEEPAAHAQKPDLQRKSPLELGPTPLFDDSGFLGQEGLAVQIVLKVYF
jgi:hypothetical protein